MDIRGLDHWLTTPPDEYEDDFEDEDDCDSCADCGEDLDPNGFCLNADCPSADEDLQ